MGDVVKSWKGLQQQCSSWHMAEMLQQLPGTRTLFRDIAQRKMKKVGIALSISLVAPPKTESGGSDSWWLPGPTGNCLKLSSRALALDGIQSRDMGMATTNLLCNTKNEGRKTKKEKKTNTRGHKIITFTLQAKQPINTFKSIISPSCDSSSNIVLQNPALVLTVRDVFFPLPRRGMPSSPSTLSSTSYGHRHFATQVPWRCGANPRWEIGRKPYIFHEALIL